MLILGTTTGLCLEFRTKCLLDEALDEIFLLDPETPEQMKKKINYFH